jgi:DNA uptake protein ComE-like DNA-binding protein
MPLFRRNSKPGDQAPQPEERPAGVGSLDEAVKSALTGEHHVEAEAERRVQEAERSQGVSPGDAELAARSASAGGALFDELRVAEENLSARREQEELLAKELAATEARLAEGQKKTEEALERAAVRLQEVEQRAMEAEARADRAERLAVLKAEELERETRLREILDRIAEAESRASAAESRARSAVSGIGPGTDPAPPTPAPPPGPGTDPKPPDPAPAPQPPEPAQDPELPEPARDPQPPEPDEPEPGAKVNVNSATYDELRSVGLSVTQTGRVLAQREHKGRFNSVDELDEIPGFPGDFLGYLKSRLEV